MLAAGLVLPVATVELARAAGTAGASGEADSPGTRSTAALAAEGRELFSRDWQQSPPEAPALDGLGPLFNAVSCVGCHRQAGAGGGGPNENNVNLLSVRPVGRFHPVRFRSTARRLHPAFSQDTPNLVLHHFGEPSPEYSEWRDGILARPGKAALDARLRPSRRVGSVLLELSQRNTPALFGAGIIDAIPVGVLRDEAERQRRNGAVSGRVARTARGGAGRFGWRGQVATLADFVRTACANELGLQTATHPQPVSPVAAPDALPRAATDLTEAQCDALTAFCASLPAPVSEDWSAAQTAEAGQGEQLFASIGCGECHRRDLGPAVGIYSDLLLHDMGSSLSDPVPALPEFAPASPSPGFSSGYSGGAPISLAQTSTTNILQEWRTPPLWGVRSSAPYLHDGRAATLEEAVLLHAGEGLPAVRRFKALNDKNRGVLISFLNSLAAPGKDHPAVLEYVAPAVAGQVGRPEPPAQPGMAQAGPLSFGATGFSFDLESVARVLDQSGAADAPE
jgi:CxxC motif-containing protein (DUF1111 family)